MTHSPPVPSRMRSFRLLATEALRDALRSRVALWAGLAGFLGLMLAERCTQGGGTLVLTGEPLDPALAARVFGPLLFALLALLGVTVAGLVAADALARPLAEGTVSGWLARPVSRSLYALARLGGVVALSVGAGALVLGGALLFLHQRQGLAPGPGLAGIGVFALDALVVSALAMAASLYLPRVITSFAVLLSVQLVAVVDAAQLLGVGFSGWMGALERHGPPLGLVHALAPWLALDLDPALVRAPLVRLAAWAAAGVALLLLAFRRIELMR